MTTREGTLEARGRIEAYSVVLTALDAVDTWIDLQYAVAMIREKLLEAQDTIDRAAS